MHGIEHSCLLLGKRVRRGQAAEFDFRCFFLVGDRPTLCSRIDRRCEKMLGAGLLEETAQLLLDGHLQPWNTAARCVWI